MTPPDSGEAKRIQAALKAGSIDMWELFEVQNKNCGSEGCAGAPPWIK
jgi:hypothetical protein